jgi:hypothetical protein
MLYCVSHFLLLLVDCSLPDFGHILQVRHTDHLHRKPVVAVVGGVEVDLEGHHIVAVLVAVHKDRCLEDVAVLVRTDHPLRG